MPPKKRQTLTYKVLPAQVTTQYITILAPTPSPDGASSESFNHSKENLVHCHTHQTSRREQALFTALLIITISLTAAVGTRQIVTPVALPAVR